jgi:hypothetical protein
MKSLESVKPIQEVGVNARDNEINTKRAIMHQKEEGRLFLMITISLLVAGRF